MGKIRIDKKNKMSYRQFSKMFEEASGNNGSLDKIKKELSLYEKKHSMSSKKFYDMYNKGELEDKHEFTAWAGKYQVYLNMSESQSIPDWSK